MTAEGARPVVRPQGRHLDRLAGRADRAQAPLSALFELTGRCNLDCGHCYLDIAHPPDELSTAEACAVVDQLADAGTLFLTLTGGELFLRKDAIVVGAHARRRGLAVRLFTNATRITRGLAREIAALRPLAVEVSVYGAHAAAHEAVTRRPHALRRTLRGVALLKRAGVNVGLKAPLLQGVTGELEALGRYADRLGVPLAFDPLVKPRLDGARGPLALRADATRLAEALRHPRSGFDVSAALPPPPGPDEAPCAIGRRTVRIGPDGQVYPCPTYPAPIGSLREHAFAALWAGGPLLDRLRAVRWRDLHGDCAGCSQAGYCGRCSAVALLEHGAALGPARESCRVAEAKARAAGAAPRDPQPSQVHLRVVR